MRGLALFPEACFANQVAAQGLREYDIAAMLAQKRRPSLPGTGGVGQ